MWLAIRQVSPCSSGKYYIRPLEKGSRWDSVAYPFEKAHHLQLVLSTMAGLSSPLDSRSRRCRDRMVVRFITTYAISACHY
jgi:hypothetical protein